MTRMRELASTGISAGRALDLPAPRDAALLVLVPSLVTAVLWLARANSVSLVQAGLATALLLIPYASFHYWRTHAHAGFPVFGCVALMYWVYFAIPLFWGDRLRPQAYGVSYLPDTTITPALVLALLAVLAQWAGTHIRVGGALSSLQHWHLPVAPAQWGYMRFLLLLGMGLCLLPSAHGLLGSAGSQFTTALQTTVPFTVFAYIFRRLLRTRLRALDIALITVFALVEVVTSLSTGWLFESAKVGIVALLIYMMERRKLPIPALTLVIVFVAFFAAGKSTFRATYWAGINPNGGQQASMLTRATAWLDTSMISWEAAIASPSAYIPPLRTGIVDRLSLLNSTANIIQQTPSTVKYQNGATYASIVTAWIPRAVWPDKPSQTEASRFYQTAYQVTAPNALNNVSLSAGVAPEAYINFGWPGVIVIMFLIGVLLGTVQRTLCASATTGFVNALGAVAVMQLMLIEWQMGFYIATLVENTFFILLVLWPVLDRSSAVKPLKRLVHPRMSGV
jgi:hypothetical protein